MKFLYVRFAVQLIKQNQKVRHRKLLIEKSRVGQDWVFGHSAPRKKCESDTPRVFKEWYGSKLYLLSTLRFHLSSSSNENLVN